MLEDPEGADQRDAVPAGQAQARPALPELPDLQYGSGWSEQAQQQQQGTLIAVEDDGSGA